MSLVERQFAMLHYDVGTVNNAAYHTRVFPMPAGARVEYVGMYVSAAGIVLRLADGSGTASPLANASVIFLKASTASGTNPGLAFSDLVCLPVMNGYLGVQLFNNSGGQITYGLIFVTYSYPVRNSPVSQISRF